MASTTKGKWRMGWIGWTATCLVLLGVVGYVAFRHALQNNAVAVLDGADRLLNGGDGAIQLVAQARFGKDPAQKLEMFVPQGAKGALPIVVFIHGGSWASGDPHDYRFIARTLCAQGYAVVLAGYRLYPQAKFPGMLEDGAAALRWVHDNAGKLGGDPARIALMGHSAGAYNVMMLSLDPQWLKRVGLDTQTIRGTVALAGPFDFLPLDSPATINSFGDAPDPSMTQPVNFAHAGAPPLLLVTGDADTRVKPRNSKALARRMTEAGVPTQPVLLEGVSHEMIIMMFARPFSRDARALDVVLPFLAKVTAPSVAVQAQGG
ncbi:alpha/beta hydrolase [Novosphingobium taihuense]|uniref:Acetyl esterase/lipase n=1 Tax=Novosphingobium taihuense TaxID=260085 RepID=A0A7W7EUS2_9SPHN|nr:alpha/beta hydrolase [Novosphingobium taihuense]MBB4614718.1 acetyl esterase/lipase [Novosphingobium taihuense]